MAPANLKEVLVIGGTGAQGLPVVHCSYLTLPVSRRYTPRFVLTTLESSIQQRSLRSQSAHSQR